MRNLSHNPYTDAYKVSFTIDKPKNNLLELFNKVLSWAEDRNFFGEGGATVQSQFVKLVEETGELAGGIARNKSDIIKDSIGDVLVVLINIARLCNTSIGECLALAYDEIKDRKGEWRNGVFVKESDLGKGLLEDFNKNSEDIKKYYTSHGGFAFALGSKPSIDLHKPFVCNALTNVKAETEYDKARDKLAERMGDEPWSADDTAW